MPLKALGKRVRWVPGVERAEIPAIVAELETKGCTHIRFTDKTGAEVIGVGIGAK